MKDLYNINKASMKGSYGYKHVWKIWKHLVFMKIHAVHLKVTSRPSAKIQMVGFIATESGKRIYIKLKGIQDFHINLG